MSALALLLLLAAIVLLGLLAPRFGVDTRPGGDRPPDGWFGARRS
jgi:hypothetical protein